MASARTGPLLAWPMTLAMLALAGIPATAGFIGKLFLIEAAVDDDYAWLGVVIVLGSMISLVYYLRVIAAMWMRSASEVPLRGGRPVPAGAGPVGRRSPAGRRRPTPRGLLRAAATSRAASRATPSPSPSRTTAPRERRVRQPEVVIVAVVCALLTVALGVYPDPLFDAARDAGAAIAGLV